MKTKRKNLVGIPIHIVEEFLRCQRNKKVLLELSDNQLNDVGLSRQELASATRFGFWRVLKSNRTGTIRINNGLIAEPDPI